jgi:hypothetical protein
MDLIKHAGARLNGAYHLFLSLDPTTLEVVCCLTSLIWAVLCLSPLWCTLCVPQYAWMSWLPSAAWGVIFATITLFIAAARYNGSLRYRRRGMFWSAILWFVVLVMLVGQRPETTSWVYVVTVFSAGTAYWQLGVRARGRSA